MDYHKAGEYLIEKLTEQGERSIGHRGCLYVDSKGNRCSVGWLMKDPYQLTDQQNKSRIRQLLHKIGHECFLFGGITDIEDIDFLERMQVIHDNPNNWDETGFLRSDLIEFTIPRPYGDKDNVKDSKK